MNFPPIDPQPILASGQTHRSTTFAEIKRMVVLKNRKASRCTYTWCCRCKCVKERMILTVYQSYQYLGCDYALLIQCPHCGHSIEWALKGYSADPKWQPESSFRFPRDSQRATAYNWENQFFAGHHLDASLPESEAIALYQRIWAAYDIPAPTLRLEAKGKRSFARGHELVQLTGWHGLKAWVVVHECAHSITHFMQSKGWFPQEAGHGPNWVANYAALLEQFLGVDAGAMLAQAKRQGVEFTPLSTAQARLRAYQK